MSPKPTTINGDQLTGFAPLAGNFTYCPNQFFEVCLRNQSRGAVRLVGFLLHKTLGWLDGQGLPVQQHFSVTFRELIEQAGISRGALTSAIDEAVTGNFIEQLASGQAKAKGQPAKSTAFALRWDTGDTCQNETDTFAGFYAGEGFRSPIPGAFFSDVLPTEPLSVTKVVGAVLRRTVGYRNQFGGFRAEAPLSFSYLQHYVNLADRKTLASALRHAEEAGYIRRVREGRFHSDPQQRQAACYAVRWQHEAAPSKIGSKTPPSVASLVDATSAQKPHQPIGSEFPPRSVQNSHQDRFKNPTDEKKTSVRKHNNNPVTVVVENQNGYQLLKQTGFDERTSVRLSAQRLTAEIEQQIRWLPLRQPAQNPFGMLRRAIEENWSAPVVANSMQQQGEVRQRENQVQQERLQQDAEIEARKRQSEERRAALLGFWKGVSAERGVEYQQQAIDQAVSDLDRGRLRRSDPTQPEIEILEAMARDLRLPSF